MFCGIIIYMVSKKESIVRKTSLLLVALFLCAFGVTVANSANLGATAVKYQPSGEEVTQEDDQTEAVKGDKVETASKTEEAKAKDEEKKDKDDSDKEDDDDDEEESSGLATMPDGPAYVGAIGGLNIRSSAWGNIITAVVDNTQVTICGREGDWYKISSPTAGYVHARYIFDAPGKAYAGNDPTNPNGSSSSGSTGDVIIDVDGDSVQGKVVSAAKQIHDKYQGYQAFPYHAYTEGGNLGCAQVATSVLCAAGVLSATDSVGGLGYASLGCVQTISLLEQAGWSSVSWPPYQAGDVVFWETYQPGPSHVGIVMNSGNSAQAMNNSSSKRMPNYSDIEAMKICKIMRKC